MTPASSRRIVQISDTHLSRWDGPIRRNFRALTAYVNDVLRPDLVINSGDIVLSNPDAEEDFAAAVELHAAIEAPTLFLPGNHDVGEPHETSWWAVSSDRLARFGRFFGRSWWLERLDDFAIVGINSQVLGTGLPEEAEQWDWLTQVSAEVAGQPVLVFQHMSFWTSYHGSDQRDGAIAAADRERILGLLQRADLRGVANGHTHRYRKRWHGTAFELWAPSASFLVARPESDLLPEGLEQVGVVLYELDGRDVKATFQTVPGLEEVESGGFDESRLIRQELRAAQAR